MLRAKTLLAEAAPKIARARRSAAGYASVAAALGENIARWAYADKDTGSGMPGHKRSLEAERALLGWRLSRARWCLVLSGPTGLGKTIAAARYVADRGGSMVRATDADRWGYGGGEALRAAETAAWLLVDDMGDEKTKPGAGNLETLLCSREAAGRPTVITTTMAPADLVERSDHLASRLRPHFRMLDAEAQADRRTDVAPFNRGIARQFLIADLADAARMVASGTLDPGCDNGAVERLAAEVGIDMSSGRFAAALGLVRERVATLDAEAAQAVERFAERCEAAGQPSERDSESLAWLEQVNEEATA